MTPADPSNCSGTGSKIDSSVDKLLAKHGRITRGTGCDTRIMMLLGALGTLMIPQGLGLLASAEVGTLSQNTVLYCTVLMQSIPTTEEHPADSHPLELQVVAHQGTMFASLPCAKGLQVYHF